MKRRKFLQSSALGAALPLSAAYSNSPLQSASKALIEHRTYELRFGGNRALLLNYLNDVYRPALNRKGVNNFMILGDYSQANPVRIHVIISYPNLPAYIAAQELDNDSTYVSQAQSYHSLTPDQALYNRFSSSLLLAFDGMPQIKDPVDNAGLFELRTYEGYSEDAVRRKIKMFNDEEIDLFNRTGLYPVFFGKMIAGIHRPSLVYMLGFRDMAERDENWATFVDHPEWKTMAAKPEYANTVNNIRREFLIPL
ncbi:MAG: NIPSNAP family protein [Cyclobacteriaceae bacterium]